MSQRKSHKRCQKMFGRQRYNRDIFTSSEITHLNAGHGTHAFATPSLLGLRADPPLPCPCSQCLPSPAVGQNHLIQSLHSKNSFSPYPESHHVCLSQLPCSGCLDMSGAEPSFSLFFMTVVLFEVLLNYLTDYP